ncbi:MAG: hypothetical protein OET79_13995 [Nitrospirota bacterium]|nr:hypothetical protein [Nitrospirota bacterium]
MAILGCHRSAGRPKGVSLERRRGRRIRDRRTKSETWFPQQWQEDLRKGVITTAGRTGAALLMAGVAG